MAKTHNWVWKTSYRGFWVVCGDCGKSDKWYNTEEAAKLRMNELKTKKPSSLQRLFPKQHW